MLLIFSLIHSRSYIYCEESIITSSNTASSSFVIGNNQQQPQQQYTGSAGNISKNTVSGFIQSPYPVQPKFVNYAHEQTSTQTQPYTQYSTDLGPSNIYYGSNVQDNDQIYFRHSINNSAQPSASNQMGPNQIVVDLHSGHHHHLHHNYHHHHHMTYHNSDCSDKISHLSSKSQQQPNQSNVNQKLYGQAHTKQHINQSQPIQSQYGYKTKSQRIADVTPVCQSDHHQPYFGSIKENKLDPNEYLWNSTGQNKPSSSPYMTNTVQTSTQGPSQTSSEPTSYIHSHLLSHPLQHQYFYINASKGSSSPTTASSYQSNRSQKAPSQLSSSSSQSSTNTQSRSGKNQ